MDYMLSAGKSGHQGYSDRPLQVMLVDDQEASRHKLCAILHGIGGFQVVAESITYHDAFLLATQTPFDLVVTQLNLHEGNGIELTYQLKQLSPSPHVVILAPTIQDELLMKAFLAGVDGYLTRDTSTHDFQRAFKAFQWGGLAMLPAVSANVIHLLVERYKSLEAKLAVALQSTMQTVDAVLPQPPQIEPGAIENVAEDVSPLHKLSPQEEKVFQLIRQGYSNKQIAAQLAISPYTVGKHVQNILRKLGVANRTQAAAYTPFEG